MKLYLSSYRIPIADELASLIGKPLHEVRVALIPNAKDYYAKRAKQLKVDSYVTYFQVLGCSVDVVDLQTVSSATVAKECFSSYDLVWAVGGNTFCLRYEMRRSGFESALPELLQAGLVYGGDSAGALVAGRQIGGIGIEKVDTPEFAEEVIHEGLGLVANIIVPHADDPYFTEVTENARNSFEDIIELKNTDALIVDEKGRRIVTAEPL